MEAVFPCSDGGILQACLCGISNPDKPEPKHRWPRLRAEALQRAGTDEHK